VHFRKIASISAVALAAVFALTSSSLAATYSSVFVYGDSLSDNGNLYAATGGTIPPPPYYNGRFSNGPVAVEQLAGLLGSPLHDFAWGGATTGIGNQSDGGNVGSLGFAHLPGMLSQLAAYPVPSALVPSSLFVVWGGATDFELGGSAIRAAADIDAIVNALKAEGANHILVPGLPDLGLTPEFYGNAAATMFSLQFNQLLKASLPATATYFDTFGLLDAIVANPAAYGLTNVTGQCYPGSYLTPGLTPCANPSQYLFWDDIHPTTAADAILANAFDQAVVTPEPSSVVLLGTGVLSMAGLLRRRWNGAQLRSQD
jgi:phospholipase/lecithinase/hemolysin